MDTLQIVANHFALNSEKAMVAYLGLLIHIFVNIQTAQGIYKNFSISYWLKDNWVRIFLSVSCLIALVLAAPEYFCLSRTSCLMTGYFSDSIFWNIFKIKKANFTKLDELIHPNLK